MTLVTIPTFTSAAWAILQDLDDGVTGNLTAYDTAMRTAAETLQNAIIVEYSSSMVLAAAEWCARHERPFDAAGRAAWLAELMSWADSPRGSVMPRHPNADDLLFYLSRYLRPDELHVAEQMIRKILFHPDRPMLDRVFTEASESR
jgi:hypothetical protein